MAEFPWAAYNRWQEPPADPQHEDIGCGNCFDPEDGTAYGCSNCHEFDPKRVDECELCAAILDKKKAEGSWCMIHGEEFMECKRVDGKWIWTKKCLECEAQKEALV